MVFNIFKSEITCGARELPKLYIRFNHLIMNLVFFCKFRLNHFRLHVVFPDYIESISHLLSQLIAN